VFEAKEMLSRLKEGSNVLIDDDGMKLRFLEELPAMVSLRDEDNDDDGNIEFKPLFL
jgi:hypothetical protein